MDPASWVMVICILCGTPDQKAGPTDLTFPSYEECVAGGAVVAGTLAGQYPQLAPIKYGCVEAKVGDPA